MIKWIRRKSQGQLLQQLQGKSQDDGGVEHDQGPRGSYDNDNGDDDNNKDTSQLQEQQEKKKKRKRGSSNSVK